MNRIKKHLVFIAPALLLLAFSSGCIGGAPPTPGTTLSALPTTAPSEQVGASVGGSGTTLPEVSTTTLPAPETTLAGLATTLPALPTTVASALREIRLTAKQFSYEPSTIRVHVGDKVRITASSLDVPHGFAINEYGIDQQLEAGKDTVIEFTADKAGTFTFYCNVPCGSGHRSMKGALIVE